MQHDTIKKQNPPTEPTDTQLTMEQQMGLLLDVFNCTEMKLASNFTKIPYQKINNPNKGDNSAKQHIIVQSNLNHRYCALAGQNTHATIQQSSGNPLKFPKIYDNHMLVTMKYSRSPNLYGS